MNHTELCSFLQLLPPTARQRLVAETIESGYAAKDVAELMGVSSAAVSRYVHGTLAPSSETLCRLLLNIDEETRTRLLETIAESIWLSLEKLLHNLPPTPRTRRLLERISDTIAELLAHKHTPPPTP
ncbi:helix-turn-helix domain-containing protein [Hyperthermus butylicus]|uniref:HTH-DNA binding protein n=1 Tax=Hyperthermus butylicus (strain DSM 5456 / JCM 9403 / PLM1-5) TaxID=415426 RepID=A2BIT4_HYPBU|nr:helix-turn-helix domain-containing protein [Hyperthermus butylicus]ABM79890.1 HTH - DNA binding protein [Hyperthermus butylicus DSM 5456]